MSTNKSKIAVIGLGNIGKIVASNLIKGNRAVILASRKYNDAKALAQELGPLAIALELQEAIKQADIIILAVWYSAIKELLTDNAADLKGKIIIDPSNPIAPDGNGGFKKIIAEKDSAGKVIASFLPKDAKLAKALGTLGAASLLNAAWKKPDTAVLFYASDDTSINTSVEELIKDSGFEPVRVGGIDQSIRIEVFGDLHEFGALGKTVTLDEARKKI